MKRRGPSRAAVLFAAGFLLAGALHALDRLLVQSMLPETAAASALRGFGSTALFVLNLAVYFSLLLWWFLSVRRRLLPSRGRRYLLLAAVFMLFFLLERGVKYRLAENGSLLEHLCWYAYYLPLTMIPALFLLTCLSMDPLREGRAGPRRAVWLAALGMILAVVTNNLHHGMFRPLGELNRGGGWGTYENGPLWYVFYAFLSLCILLGLGLLARTDRQRRRGQKALPPALLLLLTLGLMNLFDGILALGFPAPYSFPETFVFGMLGVFESCIRSRLIPFNENYAGFFSRMEFPAEITDPVLEPVFATARPLPATKAQREAALSGPLSLDEDTRLYGKALSAGYAFWTGDEGTLRKLNEELKDAAEALETENELLEYENRQKEDRARVDARNRVYARAAKEVYGTQKKIAALLEGMVPAAPDYRERLARVLFLNAYVKRKTNFVLLAAERDSVPAEELYLALEESARFLTLCGVEASAERKAARDFTDREAAALYDSFQILAELLLDRTSGLMISLSDDALRMMAECPPPEDLPETPAEVELRSEYGQLYLTVAPKKGGGL